MNKKIHDISDSLNSILWFCMDASWLMGWKMGAYLLMIPVIATGVLTLISIEKRADIFFSIVALNCWILMNIFWMLGDMEVNQGLLVYSKIFFGIGLFCIILAVIISGDWKKTLSSFKRMRIK